MRYLRLRDLEWLWQFQVAGVVLSDAFSDELQVGLVLTRQAYSLAVHVIEQFKRLINVETTRTWVVSQMSSVTGSYTGCLLIGADFSNYSPL